MFMFVDDHCNQIAKFQYRASSTANQKSRYFNVISAFLLLYYHARNHRVWYDLPVSFPFLQPDTTLTRPLLVTFRLGTFTEYIHFWLLICR